MTADTKAQGDLVLQFEAFLRLHGDPSKLSEPMREILRMFYEAGHAAALQGRGTQEGEPSEVSGLQPRIGLGGGGEGLKGRAALAQAQKERT